jgi:hypothetical protein
MGNSRPPGSPAPAPCSTWYGSPFGRDRRGVSFAARFPQELGQTPGMVTCLVWRRPLTETVEGELTESEMVARFGKPDRRGMLIVVLPELYRE